MQAMLYFVPTAFDIGFFLHHQLETVENEVEITS